jgi:hypothetical protein
MDCNLYQQGEVLTRNSREYIVSYSAIKCKHIPKKNYEVGCVVQYMTSSMQFGSLLAIKAIKLERYIARRSPWSKGGRRLSGKHEFAKALPKE